MTIALAQSSGQAWASNTVVTTTGITTASNSLLILLNLGYDGAGYTGVSVTPSDSKSNTWTPIATLIGDSTTYVGGWYNDSGTRGASHTATITTDSTVQQSAVLIEVTGHSGAPINQSATDSQTSGTSTVTSSATTAARCLVLGGAVTRANFGLGPANWGATGTITGSAGTDVYVDNDVSAHSAGSAVWYRIVSATGAQTASRTHDTGTDWAAIVIAIAEAVGGGSALLMRRRHGIPG